MGHLTSLALSWSSDPSLFRSTFVAMKIVSRCYWEIWKMPTHERQVKTKKNNKTNTQPNKQTNNHTNKQPNKQTNKHTSTQTNKQTNNQTHKQPHKQTNKHTNKHAPAFFADSFVGSRGKFLHSSCNCLKISSVCKCAGIELVSIRVEETEA